MRVGVADHRPRPRPTPATVAVVSARAATSSTRPPLAPHTRGQLGEERVRRRLRRRPRRSRAANDRARSTSARRVVPVDRGPSQPTRRPADPADPDQRCRRGRRVHGAQQLAEPAPLRLVEAGPRSPAARRPTAPRSPRRPSWSATSAPDRGAHRRRNPGHSPAGQEVGHHQTGLGRGAGLHGIPGAVGGLATAQHGTRIGAQPGGSDADERDAEVLADPAQEVHVSG